MKPIQDSRSRKRLLVAVVVILFAVPFFLSRKDRERAPSLEEFYWVGQTYYYHLTVQPDWSNPDWQLLPACENPQLGRCVMGLGLQLDGLSVTNLNWLGFYYHITFKAWGIGEERKLRQAVIDRMEPAARDALNNGSFNYSMEPILAGRAVMLLFGVISVMLLFVLVSLYTNRIAAFAAALFFSVFPAVVEAYTHLAGDILATAFSLLAILHFEWIHRNVWQRFARPGLCRSLIALTGGLSVAFAVGSKLNAAVVGFLGAALCLLYAFSWATHSASRDRFVTMFSAMLVSLTVFVVTNPFHFPHPVSALWKEYSVPHRVLEIQQEVLPGALKTVWERFFTVARTVAFHPAAFMLVILAFVVEVARAWKLKEMPSILLLWWPLAVVMITVWLPFDRPMHVLPAIVPSVILMGVTAGRLIQAKSRSRMVVAQPAA